MAELIRERDELLLDKKELEVQLVESQVAGAAGSPMPSFGRRGPSEGSSNRFSRRRKTGVGTASGRSVLEEAALMHEASAAYQDAEIFELREPQARLDLIEELREIVTPVQMGGSGERVDSEILSTARRKAAVIKRIMAEKPLEEVAKLAAEKKGIDAEFARCSAARLQLEGEADKVRKQQVREEKLRESSLKKHGEATNFKNDAEHQLQFARLLAERDELRKQTRRSLRTLNSWRLLWSMSKQKQKKQKQAEGPGSKFARAVQMATGVAGVRMSEADGGGAANPQPSAPKTSVATCSVGFGGLMAASSNAIPLNTGASSLNAARRNWTDMVAAAGAARRAAQQATPGGQCQMIGGVAVATKPTAAENPNSVQNLVMKLRRFSQLNDKTAESAPQAAASHGAGPSLAACGGVCAQFGNQLTARAGGQPRAAPVANIANQFASALRLPKI